MEHHIHRCPSDISDGCDLCRIGLRHCEICTSTEQELTTECSRFPLAATKRREIAAGRLDFYYGGWHTTREVQRGVQGSLHHVR